MNPSIWVVIFIALVIGWIILPAFMAWEAAASDPVANARLGSPGKFAFGWKLLRFLYSSAPPGLTRRLKVWRLLLSVWFPLLLVWAFGWPLLVHG